MSGTVNRVTRTPQSIRTNSLDAYLLVMNLGQSVIGGTYRRNDVVMETRSAFLDACQPQQFMGGDHNVWANLVLPRKILDDRFARIEERQGLVIGSSNEALGLLHNYLAIVDTISPLPGSALIDHIGDTIIDLVGLATGAKGDDAELANTRGLRAARLQAVTKYIRSNYRNPALSASSIGLRTGLSARYVQDLLASTGDSLSERILELRLQDARAMLMDTRYQEKRIGDIALEVGFNDISYFNRSFKKAVWVQSSCALLTQTPPSYFRSVDPTGSAIECRDKIFLGVDAALKQFQEEFRGIPATMSIDLRLGTSLAGKLEHTPEHLQFDRFETVAGND